MSAQGCLSREVSAQGVSAGGVCSDTPTPPKTTTAADGTHPIGMHSCLIF